MMRKCVRTPEILHEVNTVNTLAYHTEIEFELSFHSREASGDACVRVVRAMATLESAPVFFPEILHNVMNKIRNFVEY